MMMTLVRRWRGRAVTADAAAGSAARPGADLTLDQRRRLLLWLLLLLRARDVRADDRLVETAAQLDAGQVAPVAVHRVVVAGRQEDRARVVVGRVAAACGWRQC